MWRLIFVMVLLCCAPISAHAQLLDPRDVLSVYRDLSDLCRGHPGEDTLSRTAACNVRAKVGRLLNRLGYCSGVQNQDAFNMRWHKCKPYELF